MSANNANGELLWSIWASTTTMTIKDSKWGLFPSVYPYYLTLEQITSSLVTKREIVSVTNRVSDTFTITRSAWYCPTSDTAITQTNTAFAFTDWTLVQLRNTAEEANKIQTDMDSKVSQTEYDLEKNVFSASSQWDDDYVITDASLTSYNDWQPIRFRVDVANTDSATLEINALWPKTLKKNQWTEVLVTWDIKADWIVTAIYNSTLDVFQFVWQLATVVSAWTDINWLTEKTTPVDDDEFIIYDNVALTNKKVWLNNLKIAINKAWKIWDNSSSVADNSWKWVTYWNWLFVVDWQSWTLNRAMTSPDWITWTSRTTPVDNAWVWVIYWNWLFVAVSYSWTWNRVMISSS